MNTQPYIRHDPYIGYTYCPGISLDLKSPSGRPYQLTVNEDGLRSNRRYSFAKPPHTFRILVFGDSFCAGQYLNNQERFSECMEALCPGLEVLNFGLEGTGTDQQLLLFERFGLKYEFDLVVVLPFIENIRRNMASYRVAIDPATEERVIVPKPRFELAGDHLQLQGVPVPAKKIPLKQAGRDLIAQTDFGGSDQTPCVGAKMKNVFNLILSMLRLKAALYLFFPHEPFPDYKNPSSEAWLLMAAILLHFKELAQSKPLVVVPLLYDSFLRYRMASNYLERFASLEKNADVHVINILPHFRALAPWQINRCFLSGDCHYSPFGHTILANALIAELEAKNLFSGRRHKTSCPFPS